MAKNIFATLLLAIFLSSCSSIFSGGTPVPLAQDDRERAMNASLYLSQIPPMTSRLSNETIKIFVVAFDGTKNDRNTLDQATERETIPATLAQLLESHGYDVDYMSGPGITSKVDAAFCMSCIPKAEEALERLSKKSTDVWKQNPGVEIRVLVIGFSRGAAIGRHFMNLVSKAWPPNIQASKTGVQSQVVRTVGLLFDTVATGKEQALQLSIAPTTDQLIHLLARDERRGLFRVVLDYDRDFFIWRKGDSRYSDRFLEITLPGVHSDVGGSYLEGLGGAYRFLAEQILVELDLLDKDRWVISNGIFNQGAHDSRGLLDKALLVESALEAPDQKREAIIAESHPLTNEERDDLKTRLDALRAAKWENFRGRVADIQWDRTTKTASFLVVKQGRSLHIQATSDWILPQTLGFDVSDDQRKLTFGGLGPNGAIAMSKFVISDKIWNAIPEGSQSSLEIVTLRPSDKTSIHFLVNRQEIERLEANLN